MQEEKFSTDKLPTRRVIRFAVKFFVLRFAQFKESKGFSTTSYIQGQRSVCPNPRIPFFLVHEYWGSEATRLGWSIGSYETCSTRKPCAKAVLETDYFTQQKQYHKRTTLRTLKISLQSIFSKEGPHYRLSEARESCHLTSNNQPIHEFGYPFGDSIPGLYCIAWLGLSHARKCQFTDVCEKERYESCSVQWTFIAETFGKKAEKGKYTSSAVTTRFPRASFFEKATRSVPETWRRMYNVLARSANGMRNGTRNWIPVQPRKAQRN